MESDGQGRGHKYKAATLFVPSICTQCHRFIFGCYNQAMWCQECHNVVHHKCKKSVQVNCYKMFPPPQNKHELVPKTFYTPTFCDQCGALIFGVYKQGIQCKSDSCKIVAHHKCAPLIGSSCGDNPHVEPALVHKMIIPGLIALGLGLIFYKMKQ